MVVSVHILYGQFCFLKQFLMIHYTGPVYIWLDTCVKHIRGSLGSGYPGSQGPGSCSQGPGSRVLIPGS